MTRNLQLYPAYATAFAANFWLPVFFLYFQSQLSVAQVLRLEALYYLAVVFLEVPSGYFSDAVGRRVTLMIAATSLVFAHALFFLGDSFYYFAAGQILLAGGMAFNSGTNTALHYESLVRLGRAEEFDQREARVAKFTFLGSGVAALVGGLVATGALRYAYGLSFLGALIALGLAAAMVEPSQHSGGRKLGIDGFRRGVFAALRELKHPALRWLTAYGIIMIVLNHLPYEFYQPYLDQLLTGSNILENSTPLSSGIITLITMVIAGQIAGRSIAIRDRLGLAPTLLLGTALQTLIIAVMAFVVHPAVLLLIVLRSCPRAIMTAPRNAAVNPLIAEDHRATYLSLESLAGRLAFSATLYGLASLGDDGSALHRALVAATLIAVMGFGILWATSPWLKKTPL